MSAVLLLLEVATITNGGTQLSRLIPTVGERLDYEVRCGPFRVGTMMLEVLGVDSLRGSACYHLAAVLELSHSFSWLFSARYDIESWCRVTDMLTLRTHKRTRESRYAADWTADMIPESNSVHYSNGAVASLLPQSRDLLSLWYYLRFAGQELGSIQMLNAHIDRRNYVIRVSIAGRRRLRVPAGDFECLEVIPRSETPFGAVYVATDSTRVPVVLRTRIGGLPVNAILQKASNKQEQR